MTVQAFQAQPKMTMEMLKMFFPIVLFSIILPLIDIVTDLRLIIRLYSGIYGCRSYEDVKLNVSLIEWNDCRNSKDLSKFCQHNLMPKACIFETQYNYATLLFGECTETQI